MTDKRTLRKRFDVLFLVESDFDALLIDHFDDVYKKLPSNPTRTEKVNLLFTMKEVAEIERVLIDSEFEKAPTVQTQDNGLTESADSAKLRQEITRLQQIIRDQEQQLSGVKSEPRIAASDGLRRLKQYRKELTEIIDSPEVPLEHDWIEIGHKTLSSLEGALGQFSTIVNDFRYRFSIEKQPILRDYLPLINAAIAELQQDVDEERSAADALYGAIPNNRSRKSSPWL